MTVSEHILGKLKSNDASLVDLSFSGSGVGDEGAKMLAKALECNTVLQSLELGNSNIGSDGATALAKTLAKTNSLKTLYLRGNKIGDAGAIALADALKMNDCLEHLYLGGNQIAIKGVKAFAEAFTKNSTLQTIYLRNNHVGDEGAQMLAEGLIKNFALRVLNVANAELTANGCRTLLTLLNSNSTLQSVVFEHNGVDAEDIVKSFDERLKYNSSIIVVTSNAVAKKILAHCEEYYKASQSNKGLEGITQKVFLSRAEQYHWSGNNFQGNAILCAGFLQRMIFGRYFANQEVAKELVKIAHTLYEKLFTRTKEDLNNPKVQKPNSEILEMARSFVS